MKSQLTIIGNFKKSCLEERKSKINILKMRAGKLYEEWVDIFGRDTPVPIDRAWHNLAVAMDEIQTADQCDPRIETAREQLAQANWIINCEQSESNSKPH